jgi:FG-GAP-like repeat
VRIGLILLFPVALVAADRSVKFVEHTLATDLKGGYQVIVADVNHDGKPDLIALASGMKELFWFENPTWERHVIVDNQTRMINCAAWDTDGDGIPEIVLATGFANEAKNSIGVVSVLKHNGDPRNLWTATEIDRLTTSHRLRWADIDGSGKKVLVNQPLTGAKADAPEYRDHTPLVFYRPGAWKRELISDANEGVVHGIYIVDWDRKGRDAILSASFVGIDLFRLGNDGTWTRTEISKGAPGAWPKSGSSDVAVGRLGKQRYLAAIEPWHGNQVAIYHARKGAWERQVIDESLVDGHTIWTGDFNHDGNDEVVAGFRGKGRSVFIYYPEDTKGTNWSKHILDDGGMAAAACAIADLNGDGRPDIACIGSATTNLKWYENKGAH